MKSMKANGTRRVHRRLLKCALLIILPAAGMTGTGLRSANATASSTQALCSSGAHQLVALGRDGAKAVAYRSQSDNRYAVLHRTENPITNAAVVEVAFAPVVFARWDEPVAGAIEHYQAISKDGGRTWSRTRRVHFDVPLRAGALRPGTLDMDLPAQLEAGPGSNLYIVQFETPSLAAWRDRLAGMGAEVLAYLPHHAHVVRMAAGLAPRVLKEPFVRRVDRFHPAYRLQAQLAEQVVRRARGSDKENRTTDPGPGRYVLQTFTAGPEEKALLAADVHRAGGSVLRRTPNGYLLEAELTLDQVLALSGSNHLFWLEPWLPPEDDMDVARNVSGVDYVAATGPYRGAGVRGEVMDSGVMQNHPDFGGLLIHGPAPDVSDHGTATYGIVFGDGSSDSRGTGVLPSARGYFADYNVLGDRYQHTRELVTNPINAVFQSNSWGTGRTLDYTSISAQMDDIIWENDIAIFQSQSNAGSRNSRPQAWAKNIISIGGVRHFDTASLGDDCWCGGASIGPASDGRIKPDLVHFYDSVYTTDREPQGYVSGSYYTPNFNGTSSATPIAAGLGGLVFEMWADDIYGLNPPGTSVFEKRPHASTLKAILINTAQQYPFAGPNDDAARAHQGWGLPNVQDVLDRAPLTRIVDESSVLAETEWDGYWVEVPAGQGALKVTMVYTDRAGAPASSISLVNDLSLRVVDPNGTEYWGNHGLDQSPWSDPGGEPDTINNVENVFVENPLEGIWLVEIYADQIVEDVHVETPEVDQDYGLVIYGVTSLTDCGTSIPRPTNPDAQATGDNEITITWSGTSPQYRVFRAQGGCGGRMQALATVTGATTYVDTTPSGSIRYGYVVKAVDLCESVPSDCVETVTTGACLLEPSFAGLQEAEGAASDRCGIVLNWSPGKGECGGPIRYNVYRSTDPAFQPDPANRIGLCLPGSSFLDQENLVYLQDYYYIVQAEDLAGDPTPDSQCGGRPETNTRRFVARPVGPATVIYETDFEAGLDGWTVRLHPTQPASTGQFVVGDPVGTVDGPYQAQPEDDHTPNGVNCLYTGENPTGDPNVDDVDGGGVIARSPDFNAAGFSTVNLSYWRWHYYNSPGLTPGGILFINLCDDGAANCVALERFDGSQSEPEWTRMSFDLETYITLTDNMSLEFTSADRAGSATIVETALDDLRIASFGACASETGGPDLLRNDQWRTGTSAGDVLPLDDVDDFYLSAITQGIPDPDTTVVSDAGRPLVFYGLDASFMVLRLEKRIDGRLYIYY